MKICLQLDYWLKIMKLTSIAMIVATAFLSVAKAHIVSGQNVLEQRLSIHEKEQALQDVLKKIEQIVKVNFTYQNTDVQAYKKVTIYAQNLRLKEVLAKLLPEADLEYVVVRKNIVIRKTVKVLNVPEIPVTGTVTSDEGDPLPGVNVMVKGTTSGITTDSDGRFNLNVPDENAVLVFSFIGYKTREEPVGVKTIFQIVLSPDITQLQDIVVVGYGTLEKNLITGAVTTARLEKMESKSYNTMAETLMGTVPGIIVQNNGGDPMATPTVNIRGFGGIGGDKPLWVVDGVIVGNTDNPQVNPNDIESISVLKDASAAVYGARASGGVIIVTTKKGKGVGLKLSADAKFGFQSAWKKLEVLNASEFAEVSNLAADNAGIDRKDAFNAAIYPEGQITRTNWMDEIFRTGKIQEYNLSISGGNERSVLFTSFGYRKNEGILLNTNIERYNLRINSDHKITNWLTIGENLSISHTDGQGANNTSPYTGAVISAMFYPPHITPYDEEGNFSGLPAQYAQTYGDVINPVAYLKRIDIKRPALSILVNPYAEIRLAEGLHFKTNFGLTRIMDTYKEFVPRVLEIGKIFANNSLVMRNGNKTDILSEQTLSLNRTFGDVHDLNVVAGYTYQHYTAEAFSAYTENFEREDPIYRYFVNAVDRTNMDLHGGKEEYSLISYLGRINYSFRGKYLFSGILRRDGYSRVPGAHRWEVYPSVSAGWRISEEDFFSVPWISELKLKASRGKVGNLGTLPINAYNIPLASTKSMFGQNGVWVDGYAEDAIVNPDLKWGITTQTNIGLETALLDDRITFEADYFVKKIDRMILQIPVPSMAGVSNGPYVNLPGQAVDRGIELGLTVRGNTSGVIGYTVNGTFTHLRNEVEELIDDLVIPQGFDFRIGTDPVRIAKGQPLYSYYLIESSGIFQSQEEVDSYTNGDGALIQPNAKAGDLKFVDRDGNGRIDSDDRYFAGSAYPKFSYGISASFTFKGFDVNFFLQGIHGNKLFNGLKYTGLNAGYSQGYNMLRDIRNAWSPANTSSDIPRITARDENGNFGTISDWYLESGSFARLRNFTLGYTIPSFINDKLQVSSLRVFFTSQNLFTLTNYSGSDPEIGVLEYGKDYGRYPQPRVFMFGINVQL